MKINTLPEAPLGPVLVESDRQKPFIEHLEELRRRLLRAFLWLALGTAVSWRFADRLLELIVRPVGQVVYLSPVEPFLVHVKTAFLGGIVLVFPLLFLEVWGFLKPALRPSQRWPILVVLPAGVALFVAGLAFGWNWLVPSALQILRAFGATYMVPMLTVGHYLSFAGWLVIGCGLIFEVPLIILGLVRVGWVEPRVLVRQWRLAVIAILVIAALITPTPDIFTQLLLAAPLAALYLLSVGLSFLVRRE